LIISLLFSILCNCYVVYAGEEFIPEDNYLLIMGPGHDFGDQIKYVENAWPYNFSLNIIKAESDPECHTGENSIAYCNVKVVNIDSLYLRWVSTSLSSPNTVFTLHYWYITGNTKFKVIKDTEYIVFLAPTHSKDVFSPTLITIASDKNKKELTTILIEYIKNNKN